MLRLPEPDCLADQASYGCQDVATPRRRQRTPPEAFRLIEGSRSSEDVPPHSAAEPEPEPEPWHEAGADAGHLHEECYACPVGTAYAALRATQVPPDTIAHLMAASRELLAAAKAFMEGLESTLERQQHRPAARRSQRVHLD